MVLAKPFKTDFDEFLGVEGTMVISSLSKGSGQDYTRSINLNDEIFTACHLFLKLT